MINGKSHTPTHDQLGRASKRRRYYKDHPAAAVMNEAPVRIDGASYKIRFVVIAGRILVKPSGRLFDELLGGREAALNQFAGKSVRVHYVGNVDFNPDPTDLVHDSEFVPLDDMEQELVQRGDWPAAWAKVREFAERNEKLRARGEVPESTLRARKRWDKLPATDEPPPPSSLKAAVLARIAAEDATLRAANEARESISAELDRLKADVMEAATMGSDREVMAALRIIAERLATA